MTQIRFDRLKQLAQHLKTGKLGHKVFDFGRYNDVEANYCGTAGCAIGECPILFPEYWEFSPKGVPILIGSDSISESMEQFFNISFWAACHLFLPDDQKPSRFGGVFLAEDATKEQVADNILAFCEKFQTPTENDKHN